jgi:hypothetical protein
VTNHCISIPGPKYAFFTVCSPDPHVSLRHPSQVSRRYDVLRRRVVQSALQNPWELGMNIWNLLTGFQYTHLWHFCIIITKPSAPAPSTPLEGDPYWCQRWWWRSAPNMNPLKNAVGLLVESPLPYIIPSPYIKHPSCKPSCWIYSWLGAPKIGVVFNITLYMVIWPSYGKPPFWIGKLNTTKLLNHWRVSVLISSPKGSKSFRHHSIAIFPVGASSMFHLFLLLGLFWWMNPTSSCPWANPPHPDTPADLRCCSFDLGAGHGADVDPKQWIGGDVGYMNVAYIWGI